MHYPTVLLALLTTVLATPIPQADDGCAPWGCESTTISAFNLFRNETSPAVLGVSFTLTAAGATNPIECARASAVEVGQDIIRCSGTNYSFEVLAETEAGWMIKIYHQLGAG